MIAQRSLDECSATRTTSILYQISYLKLRQFKRCHSLNLRRRVRKMVNKRIRGKCEYNLCCGQFIENTRDKREFYFGEPCLIEKKDRTTSTGLSPLDLLEDAVNFVFKPTVADNNSVAFDCVSAFGQNLSKMVCVGGVDIDEVMLAIELQSLGASPVQSVFGRFRFLQHNQRCAVNGGVAVPEYAPSSKAVNKIEFEFLALGINVQSIEIGAKIATQDGQFRLAVFLDQGRRFVRVPFEIHGLSLRLGKQAWRCIRFLRFGVHPLWESVLPIA